MLLLNTHNWLYKEDVILQIVILLELFKFTM